MDSFYETIAVISFAFFIIPCPNIKVNGAV